MSTAVAIGTRAAAPRPHSTQRDTLALLGCGTVGSAVARLLSEPASDRRLHLVGALVKDPGRRRSLTAPLTLTQDPASLLASRPSVVVELLGGTEPARTLVLEALSRHIPVVTANKTLLARCGAELRAAANASRTPLLYEAAVIAGVPFLGTFARRPRAAGIRGLQAILNGTSNFVLTACADGQHSLADALLDAQRLGYAERDPRNDITGVDACEKLSVLLQQFAGLDVEPDAIETEGIQGLTKAIATDARELGGTVKPLALADWLDTPRAFVGPAFVPANHPLASVDGVENAILLDTPRGRLRFQGPGAGPEVTAATVLDDVHEIVAGAAPQPFPVLAAATPRPLHTGWLVSLEGTRLPSAHDLADDLAGRGVYVKRSAERRSFGDRVRQPFLTWPVERETLAAALSTICRTASCEATHLRALDRASQVFSESR